MRKDNQNTEKVTEALISMLQDPEAVKAINKKVGEYDWFISKELLDAVNYLEERKNPKTKAYLIKWQRNVLGYDAVDK